VIRSFFATIIFLSLTVVLSIISVPAALDRSGSLYFWFARIWAKIFLFLYGIKLHIAGRQNINKNEHYIFVANHSSYTDIPILFAVIPTNIRLFLRHTLTRIPIWGWALYLSPMIVINRSSPIKAKKTLTRAAEIIHEGASVLLFPEGTRTRTGLLQTFKRGAFNLSAKSQTPVVPILISGSFEALPPSSWLPRPNTKVSVTIGHPLAIDNSIVGEREQEIDLMRRAESAIRKMHSE
jgi:1-acyl-sn-glycerol-3-phosphate acyltransferase